MSDVVRKIRKLLDLSRSGSDAEAALAAERAAQLMREHALSEAEVRLVDHKPAEAITELDADKTKKRVAWRVTIMQAAASRFGCHMYFSGATVRFFGRESAIQTAAYTAQYLCTEVERLADEAWEREGDEARAAGQGVRVWKGSFRVGAAGSISRRLYAQRRDEVVAKTSERDAVKAAVEAERNAPVNPAALALVERDADEVKEAYAAKSARFGKARAIGGSVRSRTGYSAGQAAGKDVGLGGGARAALGRGQGRIGGR